MLEKALVFAREHVILTSFQHALGGFGLAIVLQVYLEGQSFAPLWLGWIFVAFSVAVHIYEFGLALTSSGQRSTTATQL